MTTFLFDGPEDAPVRLLLAHGAGAGMELVAMATMAGALAAAGLRVARFDFAYMAARREGGRGVPPKAETLKPEFLAAVAALGPGAPLVIGGKSMGGRVASMVADTLLAQAAAVGLVCVGYPFHPPGNAAQLRIAHLLHLLTPTLICQGTRDPFGSRAEVAGYALPDRIDFLWLEDGDHDLRPRKAVSGFTAAQHKATMAAHVAEWSRGLVG